MLLHTMIALAIITVAFAATCGLLVFRAGRSLELVKDNADTIKIVLATVAALYTAWIYYIEMRDNRIANTLAFQEQAASSHLQEAFKTIDMFWIRGGGLQTLEDYRDAMNEAGDDNQKKTEASRTRADAAGVFVRKYGLEDEVFRVYGLYKDIVVCVDQGRCHESTACDLFANDIENFRLVYRKFFEEWDALWRIGIIESLKYFHYECNKTWI